MAASHTIGPHTAFAAFELSRLASSITKTNSNRAIIAGSSGKRGAPAGSASYRPWLSSSVQRASVASVASSSTSTLPAFASAASKAS